MGKCDSCGNLSDLDNKHKMAQFILKNPPPQQKSLKQKPQNGAEDKNSEP